MTPAIIEPIEVGPVLLAAKEWNGRFYRRVRLADGGVVELKSAVRLTYGQWQDLARTVEAAAAAVPEPIEPGVKYIDNERYECTEWQRAEVR